MSSMLKGKVKEKVLRCVWFGKRKQRPTTEMGEGSFAGEILIERLIENTCKIYSYYYIFSVVTLFHEH